MQTAKRNAERAARLADASPKRRADEARSLLLESGWEEDRVSEPLRVDSLYLVRVAPVDEPRLSVVLGSGEAAEVPASLAYSSESELLLHWGETRIELSRPTHWQLLPGDSPGLGGEAADRWTVEDVFGLLSPERMLSGEPQQVTNLGRRHDGLAATLGGALATLRAEAAETELAELEHLDREVLRLFHQLLFVRVQEDRGEGCGPRIEEIYSLGGDELVVSLSSLLALYRKELNSDLFRPSQISLAELGGARLRPLLQALVVPWKRLHLNFSLSRADLAGRLYQQYLKKTPALERAGEGPRPRLLGVAVQRDEQEQSAAYYTPMSVASLLTSQTLGAWLAARSPRRASEVRLLDPACGSGSFLVAGFKAIREALEASGRTLRAAQREEILRESIFAADIDAKAIEISQLQLLEAAELSHSRLPDLGENLFVGDSLHPPGPDPPVDAVPWSEILERTGGFDAVLMNPPFGAQLRLSNRIGAERNKELRKRFSGVAVWGSDLAYYFVSLAFELKKQDGCAAIIVPRKLLDGKGATATRELLQRVSAPSRVLDFRGLSLFPGILPQVAALEFVPNRDGLEALDVADSTVDPALALSMILDSRNGIIRRVKAPRAELGDVWTPFALRWRSKLASELSRPSVPLSETNVALHQGTQSGAQERFTLRKGDLQAIGDGELEIRGQRIDKRYAPLVAWAPEIRPLVAPTSSDRLFFPYEEDKKLSSKPTIRALLEELGGLPAHPQPGAVPALRSPKVILRGFSREPAAFADLEGTWITVKGTKGGLILVPEKPSADTLEGMAALLCSSLYQWLLRGFGQPRRDETIEIAQANAEALPWPDLAPGEWERLAETARAVVSTLDEAPGPARTLAYREERSRLDALVLELLEAGPKLRATVEDELVRYL